MAAPEIRAAGTESRVDRAHDSAALATHKLRIRPVQPNRRAQANCLLSVAAVAQGEQIAHVLKVLLATNDSQVVPHTAATRATATVRWGAENFRAPSSQKIQSNLWEAVEPAITSNSSTALIHGSHNSATSSAKN